MNIDQIAAEAADQFMELHDCRYITRFQLMCCIKAAIEKATKDWKAANDILRAENRGLFAKCERYIDDINREP